MEVAILYSADVWMSSDSKELIGVFSSVEKAIEAAVKDADKLFNDDKEKRQFVVKLEEFHQTTIEDTGYIIFLVDLDKAI